MTNNNQNFNLDKFLEPYKSHLEWSGKSRLRYYEYIITKLINLNRPIIVVETGTMWSQLENNMGAFTLVFAELIKKWTGGKLITIDISEKNIDNAKLVTAKYSDVIEYVVSDSVKFLEEMSDEEVVKIDFIYFDSYDFYVPDPIPSQLHHFRELMAVYKKLSPSVHIAVDDNFLPNCWVEWHTYNVDGSVATKTRYDTGPRMFGKGTLIDYFLLSEGWTRIEDWFSIDTYHILGYERKIQKEITEVASILQKFYSEQDCLKPKLERAKTDDSIYNPSNGLGDNIILTSVTPYVKIKSEILTHVNSEYFDNGFITNQQKLSIEEASKYDLGGGHCTQKLQKFLGINPSIKPKGKLKYDESRKVKNKVFVHLYNDTDWKRPIPNSLNDGELSIVDAFFKSNPIYEPYFHENITDLNEMISIMETCEFFLGIDSGPMHVAAALNLKSIILINDPNLLINLPKLKDCDLPNSEWLYPQNTHLNRMGMTSLIPQFNKLNLLFAFRGEIYPYFSEKYLNITFYDTLQIR